MFQDQCLPYCDIIRSAEPLSLFLWLHLSVSSTKEAFYGHIKKAEGGVSTIYQQISVAGYEL